VSELILGTAQWGSDYGVTNEFGRITDTDLVDIMTAAKRAGVRGVDTALSYGDAQSRLRPWASELDVTTKVTGRAALSQVRDCLRIMNVKQVYSVLVHDWHSLQPEERAEATCQLGAALDRDWVCRVGVSVYDAEEIEAAQQIFAESGVPLGVMQVPASALDRRLDNNPAISDLRKAGSVIQVRSVFLQGLLANPKSAFLSQHPDVKAFHRYTAARRVPGIQMALGHVKSLSWADAIVIGVSTIQEFGEIATVWSIVDAESAPPELASIDLNLIDPRRW
jgi:aryl-alcohol dehydrogenase-like predicted oxidoreductase